MLLWGFRQWSRHKMLWLQQWCLSLWAVEFWATPTRCSVARCVFFLNSWETQPLCCQVSNNYSGKVLMTTNDHSHVLLSLWSLKIWKICERWRDSGPKISWMVVSKKWWSLARDIGVCWGFRRKKLANRGDAVYNLVTCCFITRGGDAIPQLNNNDKLIQIGYINDLLEFKNYFMYKYVIIRICKSFRISFVPLWFQIFFSLSRFLSSLQLHIGRSD